MPAIAAVLGLFVLLLWQPWLRPRPTGMLELTAIDVGQGDSLLVVLPRGEIMLVDGGGRLVYGRQRKSNLDIGEDVVSPYLWSRGIRRIDVMVATHSHQDHIGGLAAVMSNFRPKELWTGANPPAELLELARRLGIPAAEKHPAGPHRTLRGDPRSPGARGRLRRPTKSGNNDSLVLRISYGSRSFLLTGDMERAIEAKLLASGVDLHADVLKVGHHGSRTSSIRAVPGGRLALGRPDLGRIRELLRPPSSGRPGAAVGPARSNPADRPGWAGDRPHRRRSAFGSIYRRGKENRNLFVFRYI